MDSRSHLVSGGYKRYSQFLSAALDFGSQGTRSIPEPNGHTVPAPATCTASAIPDPYRLQTCHTGFSERTAHIMRPHRPSRLFLGAALCLLLSTPAFAGRGQKTRPPAIRQQERAPHANQPLEPRPEIAAPRQNAAPVQPDGHLPRWIEDHKNLSLPEQQKALENEPGFRELPPETQQRMRDRLVQLNNMNPQQRERILDRNEALERLSPPQRQQYRSAVQTFAAMPTERRRPMARAILDLREMSPEQRDQVIDSAQFRAQFSDSERTTIRTLLTAEPYAGDH